MKGVAFKLGILAIAGCAAFALSWLLPRGREAPPEQPRVDVHSKDELLRLLPGLGDVARLVSVSTDRLIQGMAVASFMPVCLPQLHEGTVDIAPPSVTVRYELAHGPIVVVDFTRIGPDSAEKARSLLRAAKERCTEKGPAYADDPPGTWTFEQMAPPRIGEVAVAFTGAYTPPSDTARDSAARVVTAISKDWTITFTTNEASAETLHTLMPRILGVLDANVGSAFLR
ncbi:hypothetical protein [Nonomuraea typhae]|uniref:hypothetical protein n=1 Tax=Nonomuraea typhae TaxID=2603600 RepID=UPI0012F7741D|nr:hypothetical protein [Nonomuraea typhae]